MTPLPGSSSPSTGAKSPPAFHWPRWRPAPCAAGTYTIAAFPSAARTYVADVWRGLLHESSGVKLRVCAEEPGPALSSLASAHAGLAVVHSYSNVPRPLGTGISVTHLADDPVWLTCRTDAPVSRAGPSF
jgi:hypothetical protein